MISNKPVTRAQWLSGLVLVMCCLCTARINAQKVQPLSLNDNIGISAGGGYTFTHTDFKLSSTVPSPVLGVGVHYFSLQFLEISLDFQVGRLKGGSSRFTDGSETGFNNDYWSSCISFRLFPAALAESTENDKILKALSTVYFGSGLGYMKSSTTSNPMPLREYGSLLRYRGSDFFVPLELGLNIPVARLKKNRILLNLNLRTSLCLSDEIDGYVPTVDANKFNDAFSTFTTAVIYKFGL